MGLVSRQNSDFEGQIADVKITLATHTILSIQKRFSSDKTTGKLFRETQQHLPEPIGWERLIGVFLKRIMQFTKI
jgi:hypothetical protein